MIHLSVKLVRGENDLATLRPDLLADWDYEKNKDILPSMITATSTKRVWWKCHVCGYEWSCEVRQRNNGSGCKQCYYKRLATISVGVDDFATLKPELLKDWDYEKNEVLPTQVRLNYSNPIWWKCHTCGYEWKIKISNRCGGRGSTCPKCSGNKLIPGVNDLATINPQLASEWNYERNGDLTPQNVKPNSQKMVWWKCPFGHEYQNTIFRRNKQGTRCPICYSKRKTSYPEQVILFYFKKCFKDTINRYTIDGFEFDVYIPSLKVAVEYDGSYFHNSTNRIMKDNLKNEFAEKHGINLYRVIDSKEYIADIKYIGQNNIFYTSNDRKYIELNSIIKNILLDIVKKHNLHIDLPIISVKDDSIEISNSYISYIKDNSLEKYYPEIAAEWDYDKNGQLTPSFVSRATEKEFWWKCPKCGLEYKKSVHSRTIRNVGCPNCSTRHENGRNLSLEQRYPQILKEWDYEKNDDLKPSDILQSSNEKVWLKCSVCGCEYQKTPRHLSRIYSLDHKSCPVCNEHKVIEGINDIFTIEPNLKMEWDYDKNSNIDPKRISINYSKKVWWKCNVCGYEWEKSIRSMVNGKCKCPLCKKKD